MIFKASIRQISKERRKLILIGFILAASIITRFVPWASQLGIGADGARDVLVAREMVSQHKLALIGPFSSAGPFTFGPWWYYLMLVPSLIFPASFLAPWAWTTILSLISPLVAYWVGRKVGGEVLGFFTGIVAAFSPTQIAFATILTPHVAAGIFSWITLLVFITTLASKKFNWIFLLGLSVALTANFHWQGLAMIPYVIAIFWFGSAKRVASAFFLFLIGFGLPFIPMLIFDLNHNFFNLRGLIYYYTEGQFRINYPNRWLTYVFEWWPQFWASVIGLPKQMGYPALGVVAATELVLVKKRMVDRLILLIIFVFLIQIIILRNYRGERVASYVLFIEPMIIFFSAWTIWQITRFQKLIGLTLLAITLIFSTQSIKIARSVQREKTLEKQAILSTFSNYIDSHYPLQVTLYDGDLGFLSARDVSQPLALIFDTKGKITQDTYPLGVCYLQCPKDPPIKKERIVAEINRYQLVDLNGLTLQFQTREVKEGWTLMTPAATYFESIDFLDPAPDWYPKK